MGQYLFYLIVAVVIFFGSLSGHEAKWLYGVYFVALYIKIVILQEQVEGLTEKIEKLEIED